MRPVEGRWVALGWWDGLVHVERRDLRELIAVSCACECSPERHEVDLALDDDRRVVGWRLGQCGTPMCRCSGGRSGIRRPVEAVLGR